MIGTDGRARNGRQKFQAPPFRTYKYAGWNGFADWLGKNKRPAFLSYEEAKKVVNALGLKSVMIGRDGRARNDPDPKQPT